MTDEPSQPERWRAWTWVPSLYFAQGLPYEVVMSVSVALYTNLKIPNEQTAFATSLLYLPWVIKPFWSPLIEVVGTARRWIVGMQLACAAAMGGVAFALTQSWFLVASFVCLWVLAFASATHDIAADGFYMSGMPPKDQAWFVGIRSTFYRMAKLAGAGLLLIIAGRLSERMSVPTAWAWTFSAAMGVFVALALYHQFALPRPPAPPRDENVSLLFAMEETVRTFFAKPNIGWAILFMLLYRFPESQLVKLAQPFLLDDRANGGLGLVTEQVGWLHGVLGVAMLTLGGILGGIVGSKYGLRKCLMPMAVVMHLPNLAYVALAFLQPETLPPIGAAIAVEQFGYGFGFAAYLMYLLELSRGPYQTAHYALCTGFMALGMMLPGLVCGYIQKWLGYDWFFVWVMLAAVPSLLATWWAPLNAESDAGSNKD